jgi:hypothetical protein
MSMHEVFQEVDAEYRNRVMHNAFGHLAPKLGRPYKGWMTFCITCFGDIVVIDFEFKNLSSSPWFHQNAHDFVYEQAKDKEGKVLKWTGVYRMYTDGTYKFDGPVEEVKIEVPKVNA